MAKKKTTKPKKKATLHDQKDTSAKKATLHDQKAGKENKGNKSSSGKFGQIGSVPFVMYYDYDAHDGQVQMPTGFTRTDSGRTSEINLIKGKPRTQFNGAARSTGSFTITLVSYLGVDPELVAKTLRDYAEKGTKLQFVIGGKSVFPRKVRITSLEQSYPYFSPDGQAIQIDCTVSIEEA